jgi:hypothetical protein
VTDTEYETWMPGTKAGHNATTPTTAADPKAQTWPKPSSAYLAAIATMKSAQAAVEAIVRT